MRTLSIVFTIAKDFCDVEVLNQAHTCCKIALLQMNQKTNVSTKEEMASGTYARHRIANGQEGLVDDARHLTACSDDSGSGSGSIWVKQIGRASCRERVCT